MIFKGIKLAAFKRKIARLAENKYRETSVSSIKTIAIILDIKNYKYLEVLKQVGEQLDLQEDDLKIAMYTEKSIDVEGYKGMLFSLKDISLTAEINNSELSDFTKQDIDLLITFTDENNTAVHLLTAYCNAGIKVGRFQKNEALLDWIIKSEDNAQVFVDELINYIKKLKLSQHE
ncbi:hypothetical protein L1I30_04545 [Gillisia sp. M10.2A]|uniref:Uncharacterized protein n=1 Tax=Gillisia lutea TaxID=2909668 RepID=A0ABS9EFK7_9FLAO|nr:hypothetical protein [Gillisia lutea]MCF4100929.1 hypothetical protein [Gillisia lutea]